jgi:hypothetical protein
MPQPRNRIHAAQSSRSRIRISAGQDRNVCDEPAPDPTCRAEAEGGAPRRVGCCQMSGPLTADSVPRNQRSPSPGRWALQRASTDSAHRFRLIDLRPLSGIAAIPGADRGSLHVRLSPSYEFPREYAICTRQTRFTDHLPKLPRRAHGSSVIPWIVCEFYREWVRCPFHISHSSPCQLSTSEGADLSGQPATSPRSWSTRAILAPDQNSRQCE